MVKDGAIPQRNSGLQKAGFEVGERDPIGPPVAKLDLLSQVTVLMPASIRAIELARDDPTFGLFSATWVIFGTQAFRHPGLEMLKHLKLSIGMPALGHAMQSAVHDRGPGFERPTIVSLDHAPRERVALALPVQ